MDVLPQEYRALRDAGVKGAFIQLGEAPYRDLKTYLLQRLLWDLDTDVEVLLQEFHEGYYGQDAAPKMLEYFRGVCTSPDNYGSRIAWLTKLEQILRDARPMVRGDEFAVRQVDLLLRAVLVNQIRSLWPRWEYRDGYVTADLQNERIDSLFAQVRSLAQLPQQFAKIPRAVIFLDFFWT